MISSVRQGQMAWTRLRSADVDVLRIGRPGRASTCRDMSGGRVIAGHARLGRGYGSPLGRGCRRAGAGYGSPLGRGCRRAGAGACVRGAARRRGGGSTPRRTPAHRAGSAGRGPIGAGPAGLGSQRGGAAGWLSSRSPRCELVACVSGHAFLIDGRRGSAVCRRWRPDGGPAPLPSGRRGRGRLRAWQAAVPRRRRPGWTIQNGRFRSLSPSRRAGSRHAPPEAPDQERPYPGCR